MSSINITRVPYGTQLDFPKYIGEIKSRKGNRLAFVINKQYRLEVNNDLIEEARRAGRKLFKGKEDFNVYLMTTAFLLAENRSDLKTLHAIYSGLELKGLLPSIPDAAYRFLVQQIQATEGVDNTSSDYVMQTNLQDVRTLTRLLKSDDVELRTRMFGAAVAIIVLHNGMVRQGVVGHADYWNATDFITSTSNPALASNSYKYIGSALAAKKWAPLAIPNLLPIMDLAELGKKEQELYEPILATKGALIIPLDEQLTFDGGKAHIGWLRTVSGRTVVSKKRAQYIILDSYIRGSLAEPRRVFVNQNSAFHRAMDTCEWAIKSTVPIAFVRLKGPYNRIGGEAGEMLTSISRNKPLRVNFDVNPSDPSLIYAFITFSESVPSELKLLDLQVLTPHYQGKAVNTYKFIQGEVLTHRVLKLHISCSERIAAGANIQD